MARTTGVVTSYTIEYFGPMWIGGLAAQCHQITDRNINIDPSGIVPAGDLWLDPGKSELESVESWLDSHSGDLQNVQACRIVRSERMTRPLAPLYNGPIKDGGAWTRNETWTRDTVLRDFTEEAQTMYDQCMYGNEDE